MSLPSLVQKCDYYQKKTFLSYLRFKKALYKVPEGKRFSLALLTFIIATYPGQNHWQTLTINPSEPKVRSAQITLKPHPIPINDGTKVPYLTAQAIFVFEPDSGAILYQHSSDTRLHPASTTKVTTALVAMDVYQANEILTVKTGEQAIGHSTKLATGQQFTVKSLLYATLVSSGNDAALTLAENYPGGGYLGFVELMNQKAQELHLANTSFTNVSGIESYNHKTTVHDLAILTKEAVKNPLFMEIVNTPEVTITDISGENQYQLQTTNLLLGKVDGLKGIKTGWTENAGECLITYTERDGKKIITVVLNSADRFGESEQLINWAFNHHTWQQI